MICAGSHRCMTEPAGIWLAQVALTRKDVSVYVVSVGCVLIELKRKVTLFGVKNSYVGLSIESTR